MDKSVFEQGAEKPSKKNRLRLGHRGRARFYVKSSWSTPNPSASSQKQYTKQNNSG